MPMRFRHNDVAVAGVRSSRSRSWRCSTRRRCAPQAFASLDPVIRDMGAGEAPALEIGEFEVNRGRRLMILGFNRPQLIRSIHRLHCCYK